jgi:hypothetical protein
VVYLRFIGWGALIPHLPDDLQKAFPLLMASTCQTKVWPVLR